MFTMMISVLKCFCASFGRLMVLSFLLYLPFFFVVLHRCASAAPAVSQCAFCGTRRPYYDGSGGLYGQLWAYCQ